MLQITKLLRSIQDRDQYLDQIHPNNLELTTRVAETLVSSTGPFKVAGQSIDTTDITSEKEAVAAIFDTSKQTYSKNDEGEGMLSPVGIAMHIEAELSSDEPYLH